MFIVNQKLGKLLRFLELEKNYFPEPFLKDLRKLTTRLISYYQIERNTNILNFGVSLLYVYHSRKNPGVKMSLSP